MLGQEVGHRWLAFLEFRDRTGSASEALLGRDQAHWSFFFDSDASVMEGNDIEDLGGGAFRTAAAVQRYSRLDQYAMGLLSAVAGAAVLLRREPDQRLTEPKRIGRAARRRDVQRHAPRRADPGHHRRPGCAGAECRGLAESAPPGVHLSRDARADRRMPAQVDKVDRIRRQWETFFLQATDNRMRADTRLQ